MPPPRPLHVTPTPRDLVVVQDVPHTSSQNINPLTIEDLKRILHQTTLQAQLCANPILVSVKELQKAVANINKEKVNPQEPPSQTKIARSRQPQGQIVQDTIAKVDSTKSDTSIAKEQENEKIG